jgi:hypothetical protein
MKLEKTDDESFVRDMNSTAILNKDRNAYNRFLLERQQSLQQQRIAADVDNLRGELSEIKQLLQQLLNGRTHGTRDS